MLTDLISYALKGHLTIKDKDTGEILLDQHNDILYGNMSEVIAQALVGNGNAFLAYMGFGNGGAYIDPSGNIVYKPSLGGANSLVKNPNANLYNTVYVKLLSNDSTGSSSYNPNSVAYVAPDNPAVNYEDIIVNVILDYSEPPTAITTGTAITQTVLDNSSFVGTASTPNPLPSTFDPTTLVFNEIALYVGSDNIFSGQSTATIQDVDNFVNTGTNFSTIPGTHTKTMITHIVFSPIQKSRQPSALKSGYTIRIQMGPLSS